MKILITGAAGFIGTNLIKDLKEHGISGSDIIGIDNMSHGTYIEEIHGNIDFNNIDILDEGMTFLFKDVDYVFHFAGLVSIYEIDKDPFKAALNNVMGSIRVFDACIKHDIKKIIFSETSAMYEDSKTLPHVEDHWAPRTFYATTKAMLHLMAESYRKTKGLTYTGLRYFNVYGPLQDFKRSVPPAACGFGIRLMQGNKPIIFGDGNRRRDFIHVDDVNAFHITCLRDSRTDNEAFNLGIGKSISLFELIDLFCKILKIKNPGFIQADEINGEAFEIYANIEKAKALNWEPKMGFYEGHQDVLKYLSKLNDSGIVPKNYMENTDFSSLKI